MTQQKQLKHLVRERMKESGQRYAAARRAVLHANKSTSSPHRPGCVAGATALRVLLAHCGRELSEAMTFGLAGGIGIGTFTFCYEKENFASFFVASRHCWHDHTLYLTRACERFGLTSVIKECISPKVAEKQLREMLASHGPCVAWVDMNALPHRGLPSEPGGNVYHLLTVYSASETTAVIGDLSDEPIEMALSDLTNARGRIKKDKYRLLAVAKATKPAELATMTAAALKACHAGLNGGDGPKNFRRNFSLDGLALWADRLTSKKDPERWERIFTPGCRLWNGLLFLHMFTEYYSSSGGLSRPIMADFLLTAGDALKKSALKALGKHYANLGDQWTALADAALPDTVAPLAEAKAQLAKYAEHVNSGGSVEDKSACWSRIKELERQVSIKFPLTDAECAHLRFQLAERVHAIHAAEVAAHRQLVEVL